MKNGSLRNRKSPLRTSWKPELGPQQVRQVLRLPFSFRGRAQLAYTCRVETHQIVRYHIAQARPQCEQQPFLTFYDL